MPYRKWSRRAFSALPAALFAAPRPSILVHEHILVDFVGAAGIAPGRYDPDDAFRVARPHLEEVKKLGCVRLQECTPNFLGRDPALLRRLSEAAGIEIWTNTGLYGARDHFFLPAYARTETAEQLAERWIQEVRNGVSGVKPRFIKIGVNRGPLGELDRKLVRAAALTANETGLTIASHTGDGRAALDQLEILAEANTNPSRFVWVHAQNEKDHAIHRQVAQAGAWVEFDGIGPGSVGQHLECIRWMLGNKLLGRTLISHDAGWYRPGEPNGGDYRGYTLLYTAVLPEFEPDVQTALVWDNPRAAFGA